VNYTGYGSRISCLNLTLLHKWCALNRLSNAYFYAKFKKTPFVDVNAVQKSKNHCGANDLSVTVISNVSVSIVLMVMLMLVLARMLIFRTLVKRSTVHNNGDGDVDVRNEVKRSRNVWFFNILVTSTNHHREFHARAGAVTVHTTLTAVRVTFIIVNTGLLTSPLPSPLTL
jgi:hypothetical protein